jgi:transcriptional regulator with XRE-family HTH domain
VSSKNNSSKSSEARKERKHFRISEVARRIGISSSALRAWEALGLMSPLRAQNRYRLYTESDIRLLQRAIFLRRSRGLNPPAIVHILKDGHSSKATSSGSFFPGQRFRRLRIRRGLSLAQVARAIGVSIGFLSAFERGQMKASVATLRRISRFYRTNILSLFDSSSEARRLIRPSDRKILETTPGVRMELLATGHTAMEPHLFGIQPGGSSGESYEHVGEEFLFVLTGHFEIWLGQNEHYHLGPGDSLYFESSTAHRWKNPGRTETRLLWINTPPTF